MKRLNLTKRCVDALEGFDSRRLFWGGHKAILLLWDWGFFGGQLYAFKG